MRCLKGIAEKHYPGPYACILRRKISREKQRWLLDENSTLQENVFMTYEGTAEGKTDTYMTTHS